MFFYKNRFLDAYIAKIEFLVRIITKGYLEYRIDTFGGSAKSTVWTVGWTIDYIYFKSQRIFALVLVIQECRIYELQTETR